MPTYGSPFYRKEDSATYSRVWLASGGAASGAVLVGYHYQQYSYNYYYYDTTDYYSNPSYNSRQSNQQTFGIYYLLKMSILTLIC